MASPNESASEPPRFLRAPFRTQRSRRAMDAAAWVLIAGLLLQLVLSLPAVHRVRVNDFPAYWAAGRMVLEGHPELIYSPDWKWFTNLPVVAVLCTPLSALPYDVAWELLWWISVASFACTLALLLWIVSRQFPPLTPVRAAVVVAVFCAFGPVMRRCLSLGQTTPLLVLLFGLVYVLAARRWSRAAGALLGLICVIKIPPLLMLPLLALRRRLALAGAAAAVVAAAVLASWVFFGSELMGQYADRVLLDNFGRVHAAFNNQSLDGAFMRLFSERGLADWVPVERPSDVRVAVLLVQGAIAALLLARARSLLWPARPPADEDERSGSLELELAVGTSLMVLVFPIVWIHYYLFLVVPLALLPFWWERRALPWSTAAACLFVAGLWLASGEEVRENAWYAAREADRLVRLRLDLQPLGALLLLGALAFPLGVIARRQRASREEPAS